MTHYPVDDQDLVETLTQHVATSQKLVVASRHDVQLSLDVPGLLAKLANDGYEIVRTRPDVFEATSEESA